MGKGLKGGSFPLAPASSAASQPAVACATPSPGLLPRTLEDLVKPFLKCKLGEAITLQRGFDLPIQNRESGSFPIFSSSGITGFHSIKGCDGPGVITGRYGTIGQVFYSSQAYWPLNTTLFVQDFKGNYPKFIYYLLQDFDFESYNDKSAVPGINRNHIHEEPIYLPDLNEQVVIAGVLSSLDDKIDLLHRQNKTLEAMAQALFRQWFIEEIFIGSTEIELGHYAHNIRRNVPINELGNHDVYVGLEHVPRKQISLLEYGQPDSLESNKSEFKTWDILFGKLRSYFHKVVFAPVNGVCSTDILVIRAKKPEYMPFCLFWFFNEQVVEHSDLGSGGTRMPRTNWEILASFKIPKPSEERIIEFNDFAMPLLKKIQFNLTLIKQTIQLRESLLPKLMSGEVRVAL